MRIFWQAMGLFLLVLLYGSSCSDVNPGYSRDGNCIVVQGHEFAYRLGIGKEGIVHFNYRDAQVHGDSVYGPASPLEYQPVKVRRVDQKLVLKGGGTQVVIDLRDYSLEFSDGLGGALFKVLGPWYWQQDTLHFSARFGEASIYGLGFRALPVNRRGTFLEAYNQPRYGYGEGEANLNYSVPAWISSEKYMVLVDDPSKAHYDFGASEGGTLHYACKAGNSSLYYWPGHDYRDLFQKWNYLTGRQPLPPLWAFGNLQSRFGYRNQAEATAILEKSLAGGIPVDAIILDLYWFGEELQDGKMGNLSWDLTQWPNPKGMVQEFKENGVKTVLITEPYFTRKSEHFSFLDSMGFLVKDQYGQTAVMDDFYFGPAGLLDITQDKAAAWMWERYKSLKEYGMEGWWVDLGEPERHPSHLQHWAGKADQIHGIYSHKWSRMMKNGFDKDFPHERFFYLARAGFAGTHRFGILPWSGDVGRNWSGLRAQLPAMMGMGMSGLAYMHSDAGGFTYAENADQELYVRWLQMACYTPIFRPHADECIPSELILWPSEVQERILPHLTMRYQLLPYLYTMAREVYETSYPMVRPMFLEFPNVGDHFDRQYMWGSALLVAPVMEPGLDSMDVFFPKGTWTHLFTGEKIMGHNQVIRLEVEDFQMPVFQREGTVLPMWQGKGNTSVYKTDTLDYRYCFSENYSAQEIYFDDGRSRDYQETGAYQKLKLMVNPHKNGISIQLGREGHQGSAEWGMAWGVFYLRDLPHAVKKVSLDGEAIQFEQLGDKEIRLICDTRRAKVIKISY
jgi:oligosaccharide 4-alpha-D-glucosyltransferase